jgi:hypothetical protein
MVVTLALLLMLQGAPASPAGQPAQPGTISGELRTPDGAPAAGVRVSALPAPRGAIKPSDGQNYYATVVPTNTAVSDLQGRYRLRNLPPGRYIILASVLGFPTYYPSTDNPDNAEVVTVEDRPLENVNVAVVLPPDRQPGTTKPEVLANTTWLSELKDAVEYLMEYPNGCIEQTTSTAYPLVVLEDLLPEMGVTVDPVQLKKFSPKRTVLFAAGVAAVSTILLNRVGVIDLPWDEGAIETPPPEPDPFRLLRLRPR